MFRRILKFLRNLFFGNKDDDSCINTSKQEYSSVTESPFLSELRVYRGIVYREGSKYRFKSELVFTKMHKLACIPFDGTKIIYNGPDSIETCIKKYANHLIWLDLVQMRDCAYIVVCENV